jgi:ATP adenylyltransferase
MSRLLLAQGSLAPMLAERTRQALARGALVPIETTEEIVADAGVDFLVRRALSLVRKEEARLRGARAVKPANPFLPHEPEMFVADISDTHIALLNKYNVIEHHLLIVTRRFVDQETLLDIDDFDALTACMAQIDGLAFYNAGAVAGASQPHKHLQLVPLPLARNGPPVAVEPLFAPVREQTGGQAGDRAAILRVPGFPFRHAFAWIGPRCFVDPGGAAARLHALYLGLLTAAGLKPAGAGPSDGEARQSAPYNLLVTRRWMLLVPRSTDYFDSVPVNALGFAGSLFVRDEAQMEVVKRAGPMAVLKAVSLPDLKT